MEIIAVCSEIHTEHVNAFFGSNFWMFNPIVHGSYSWVLRGCVGRIPRRDVVYFDVLDAERRCLYLITFRMGQLNCVPPNFGTFLLSWRVLPLGGSSLICGNKMSTRCNRGFYCRSYCLLNMFRAPLCPLSGAQEYYTVVAACYVSGSQGAAASCKPDT